MNLLLVLYTWERIMGEGLWVKISWVIVCTSYLIPHALQGISQNSLEVIINEVSHTPFDCFGLTIGLGKIGDGCPKGCIYIQVIWWRNLEDWEEKF